MEKRGEINVLIQIKIYTFAYYIWIILERAYFD